MADLIPITHTGTQGQKGTTAALPFTSQKEKEENPILPTGLQCREGHRGRSSLLALARPPSGSSRKAQAVPPGRGQHLHTQKEATVLSCSTGKAKGKAVCDDLSHCMYSLLVAVLGPWPWRKGVLVLCSHQKCPPREAFYPVQIEGAAKAVLNRLTKGAKDEHNHPASLAIWLRTSPPPMVSWSEHTHQQPKAHESTPWKGAWRLYCDGATFVFQALWPRSAFQKQPPPRVHWVPPADHTHFLTFWPIRYSHTP